MSAERNPARARRRSWDAFYSLPRIWQRSPCVTSLRARLAFVLISKLYRQMYANTGIATDSARVARSAKRARVLARLARRLFVATPMPGLEIPAAVPRPVLSTPLDLLEGQHALQSIAAASAAQQEDAAQPQEFPLAASTSVSG